MHRNASNYRTRFCVRVRVWSNTERRQRHLSIAVACVPIKCDFETRPITTRLHRVTHVRIRVLNQRATAIGVPLCARIVAVRARDRELLHARSPRIDYRPQWARDAVARYFLRFFSFFFFFLCSWFSVTVQRASLARRLGTKTGGKTNGTIAKPFSSAISRSILLFRVSGDLWTKRISAHPAEMPECNERRAIN